MSEKTITETVKKPNHLEDLFGFPSGSTEVTVTKPVTESEPIDQYDEKDEEIEKQFDTIKDMAQYTFENIQDQIEDVDPKFSARLHEVAGSYLSTMLDAVKQKAKMKAEKDKLVAKRTSGPSKINQTTNNTIISNTTDILKSLRNGDLSTLDGEFSIKQEKEDDE